MFLDIGQTVEGKICKGKETTTAIKFVRPSMRAQFELINFETGEYKAKSWGACKYIDESERLEELVKNAGPKSRYALIYADFKTLKDGTPFSDNLIVKPIREHFVSTSSRGEIYFLPIDYEGIEFLEKWKPKIPTAQRLLERKKTPKRRRIRRRRRGTRVTYRRYRHVPSVRRYRRRVVSGPSKFTPPPKRARRVSVFASIKYRNIINKLSITKLENNLKKIQVDIERAKGDIKRYTKQLANVRRMRRAKRGRVIHGLNVIIARTKGFLIVLEKNLKLTQETIEKKKKAKIEAEKRAKVEAERKRKAKIEAEKRAKEEAERKRKEIEAKKKAAIEEAKAKAEAAAKRAKAEAERKKKEAEARKAKAEAEAKAIEAEKRALEAKAKMAEVRRKAIEAQAKALKAQARLEAGRRAMEIKKRELAEKRRLAIVKVEAERKKRELAMIEAKKVEEQKKIEAIETKKNQQINMLQAQLQQLQIVQEEKIKKLKKYLIPAGGVVFGLGVILLLRKRG